MCYILIIVLILCFYLLVNYKHEQKRIKNIIRQKEPPMPNELNKFIKYITPIFDHKRVYQGEMDKLNIRNGRTILHTIHIGEADTAYTLNKKAIYIQLYKKNHTLYDYNTLVYVFLHEMAHVLCSDVGHTESFVRIYRQLLQDAKQLHLYEPKIPLDPEYPMSH